MLDDKPPRVLFQEQTGNNETITSVDYDYFVETISIKMGNVNPLVTISMADQEVFQTSLEKFINEHSSSFSNLEAKFICQMREKLRNDKKITSSGNDNNVLIILALSGNYKNKKANNNIQKLVRQDLQKIMKDNYDFLKYVHEESNNDPFFYLSNVGDLEIVKTPMMFEEYQREASSGYAAMMEENQFLLNSDSNDLKASSSLGSSAIIGISVFSVGVIILVSSMLIFRRRNSKNFSAQKRNEKRKKSLPTQSIQTNSSFTSASERMPASNEQEQAMNQSNVNSNYISRSSSTEIRGECIAPPGKLGVSIYPVDGLPVVYKVKKDSPLNEILFHMDRIIAIDEVDTSGMTAADVTRVIVSRMKLHRTITYVRSVQN